MSQHRSKAEIDKLVGDNMALLVSVAKKFKPRNHTELENYISAGSLGMVRAAYSFDPTRGAFSTHATYCINNEILKYIKYEKKHSHCIQIDDYAYEIPIDQIDMIIPSDLSIEETQIIIMKKEGKSNKDICIALDLTKAKLKIKIKKLLHKIRTTQ